MGLYYLAFGDLSTCRHSFGEAEGPVPWVAILAWANEHGLRGEQREDLYYYIAHMDEAYLEHKAKKIKKSIQGSRPKAGRRR